MTAPLCQKTVLLKAFMVSKISLFPVLTAKIRMHSNELGQNEQLNQSIIIRLNEGFVPINMALFIAYRSQKIKNCGEFFFPFSIPE